MANRVAGSNSRIFGTAGCTYRQAGAGDINDLPVTIRKDVELLDANEQVVDRVTTARLALEDMPYTPKRGDTITAGGKVYTVGKQLENDSYSVLLEVTA